MKKLVTVVTIAILLIGLVLLGLTDTVPRCAGRRPSEADVEEAVLKNIAGEYGASVYIPQWVTEVEVIEYGEPYIPGMMATRSYAIWPVKVYFIGGQRREEGEVCLHPGISYRGIPREWRVGKCFPPPQYLQNLP